MMIIKRICDSFSLSWKFLRVSFQIMYGAWRISKLQQPVISIFGSSKLQQADQYAHQANQIATQLTQAGISVMTGGGPGIMQAANCGVFYSKNRKAIKSIGIGVRGLNEPSNMCVEEYFELDHFFARKWLLTHYSKGFIVFPGGFGTLDELSEVLTLIQTHQIKKVPIVLIGKEYWQPFMQWIHDEMFAHNLIREQHLELFSITDDIDQAFCFIQGKCKIG